MYQPPPWISIILSIITFGQRMLTAKPHIWLFSYLFCFRKIMLNIRANIKCFFVSKVLDNYKHSLFLQLCVSQNMTSVHKCSQTFSWTKKCVHFGRKKDICFPRTKYKMIKDASDVFLEKVLNWILHTFFLEKDVERCHL